MQLVGAFSVFAEVSLMRPIGGLLLVPISDRIGRRSLLQLSVSMMILRSIGMAILPTTAQWGGATARTLGGTSTACQTRLGWQPHVRWGVVGVCW